MTRVVDESIPRQILGPLWFKTLRESVQGRGAEALTQLALIAVLYVGYRAGRVYAAGQESRAFDNARAVWSFERAVRLPNELSLQSVFTGSDVLAVSANAYYATVHFPFSIVALLWLWIYRAECYRWARDVMVILTATALVMHVLFPLAPPRMLPDLGFVDLAVVHGQSVYGQPDVDTHANQFAAMPSLHIGWALLLSVALLHAICSRWRWLFLAHPVITTVVVVGTANHYWLDGIVVVLVMLVAIAFVASPTLRVGKRDFSVEEFPPLTSVRYSGRQDDIHR